MLEQSNTWVEEVLDMCSKCAPLGARDVSAHLKLAPEGQNTPYWRDMSLFGVAMCRQISSLRILAQKCSVLHCLGAFEPADTSRKGLRGREEVLEKSNTWPEQVLDTLNLSLIHV